MRVKVITHPDPTILPADLTALQARLRNPPDSIMEDVKSRLWEAAGRFEQKTGRALMRQTIQGVIDGTPAREFQIPRPEYITGSISAFCVDQEGGETSFSSTFFWIDESRRKARFILKDDAEWPDDLRSVRVVWEAGYAATTDVPADLQAALVEYAAAKHEKPTEDVNPAAFDSACRGYRTKPIAMVL